MNSWLGTNLRHAALAGALVLVGCGGGESDAADRPAPALRGAALVAGTSMESWGLLVVPRGGGPAELRSLSEPSVVLWTGSARIPASVEARASGDGAVALRAADGRVYRYDPARDVAVEVGRVGGGAEWSGVGLAGVWTDPREGSALVMGGGEAWRASLPASTVWAAAAGEGTVVALVGGPGEARPLLVERDEASPAVAGPQTGAQADGRPAARAGAAAAEERGAALAPPAAVTAWGRRLAAASADGRSLVVLSLPELETVSSTDVDGPILALVPSPSSHQVYVAVGDDGSSRVVAIDRLRFRAERLARLDGPVTELRPAQFGGYLLAGGAGSAAYVPLTGEDPVPLPGRWRSDLPLGLPGGRVLVLTEDGVAVWRPDTKGGDAPRSLDVGADGWWLPVRWIPPRPERVAEGETPTGPEEGEPGERVAAADPVPEGTEDPEGPGAVGEAGATRPGAEEGAASERAGQARGAAAEGPEGAPGSSPSPGFYAIVASSQRPEAIDSLTRRLEAAGFRSTVQRHRDEARELWYRALVGPYESREEAEEAADRLRRERGLQAWISEVGPDARPEDLSF